MRATPGQHAGNRRPRTVRRMVTIYDSPPWLCCRFVEDTWFRRDRPVLDAAVSLLDESAWTSFEPDLRQIAERARVSEHDAAAALQALDGTYLTLEMVMGPIGDWYVSKVTAAARQEVGQWPTAESVIARLADGLAAAAETEPDPERKRGLKSVAGWLSGAAQGVAADVLARIIGRGIGLG